MADDVVLNSRFVRDFQILEDKLEALRNQRDEAIRALNASRQARGEKPEEPVPWHAERERLLSEGKKLRDELRAAYEQLATAQEKVRAASGLAKAKVRLARSLRVAEAARDALERQNSQLEAESKSLRNRKESIRVAPESQGESRDGNDSIHEQNKNQDEPHKTMIWACRERDEYKAKLEAANFRIRDLERRLYGQPPR